MKTLKKKRIRGLGARNTTIVSGSITVKVQVLEGIPVIHDTL
jgi:hypothetical protein